MSFYHTFQNIKLSLVPCSHILNNDKNNDKIIRSSISHKKVSVVKIVTPVICFSFL